MVSILSDAALRISLNHLLEGIQFIGPDWTYLYVNETAARHGEARAEDLLGRTMMECFPGIERTPLFATLERVRRTQQAEQMLNEFISPSGRRLWFELFVEPVPEGLCILSLDVTARRVSEERYRALFDSAADGIIVSDEEGNYVDANPSLCRMLGYSRAELLRFTAADILVASELPLLKAAREAMSTQATYHREWHFRRKDGTVFAADVITTRMPNGHRLGIIRDVTERNRLEAQYLQAQKMEAVGRLAGGVAHDFNNLLTTILGFCELIGDSLDPEEPLRADVAEIQKAGEHGARLTSQLLAFSRKQIIAPAVIDLNRVLSDMLGMLERLIGEDVTMRLRLDPDGAVVTGDRGQVEQVIFNLAVNARDAMPTGGALTIETAHDTVDGYAASQLGVAPGRYVRLTLIDTGTGMTPDVRRHLFEPFFTTKEAGKGTGLGLATVHGIVSRSGGSISVDTEVGRGTSFIIHLPQADGAASGQDSRGTAATRREVPVRGLQLLVVEDSDSLRELIRRLLTREGYNVHTAANADEAVRIFSERGDIDVLLTDVVMPGASGPEMTRRLLERRPSLKVVYMSGYTEDAIVQHGVLKPGITFLHKPFTADTLTRTLRKALA